MLTKLILTLVALSCLANAAVVRPRNAQQTPWELLEALGANGQIRGFNGTWITGEEFYYTASDKSIRKYNAATNTDAIFVTSDFLELYSSGSKFTLSPDNKKILVRYDVEEVFRHSLVAKYDVFDIATRTAMKIHKGEKLQYCTWSPIMDRLSYVYNNNVFIHFEEGLELRITSEGINGVIYNGIPDWVYEEEVLSSGSAMWWSPDGRKLAVGIFNDTNVHTFKYFLYGESEDPAYQYPKEVDLKYPKPGTPNPAVSLRIYDFSTVEPRAVVITAPIDIVSADHILQNVAWSSADSLLVTWLNRRQNVSSIQSCSIVGECRQVKRIEEPNGWIQIGAPKCLKSGKNCLLTYWIDNWYQVWNLSLASGENELKSRGDFTVLTIYGYDEVRDKLYYRATLKNDSSVYHVFSNDDCLTCHLTNDDDTDCLSAAATFSKDFSYYTVMCNGPNPAYTKIFSSSTNKVITTWEANEDFLEALALKQRPQVRIMNFTLADGSVAAVRLQLPPNLQPTKKYPMIVYVYGGPNSVRVTNVYNTGFDAFMTTKREVIYAQIDGHGTGNKGKKLLFSVNNNLGEHEVEDQIAVTKLLQKELPYIDSERTGIWGWSYGGYVTAKTLGSDTDRVFQCGISVAPVTSWLYYDTIYTERYMGLPTDEDNRAKYELSSVMERIDNFRSHDFLLIHGSGDDNVHYQQSLMLAKVLQRYDILFEQMTYTDENHSIGNFLPHLYNTMDQFWVNCLNLDVDEDDKRSEYA